MNKNLPQKSFLIFGVGAIGTYIGASLASIGQKVSFIERPQAAAFIRQKGLHVERNSGNIHIPEPVIYDTFQSALTNQTYDLAVLAVKSYDTARVIEDLNPYQASLPPFLCLQNGVENEEALSKFLGSGRVIPGTVTTAVGRKNAGDIVVQKLRGIGIARANPFSGLLIEILDAAGLKARGFNNPSSMKWSKMFTNLLANASSAILDMTPAQIFADPVAYQIELLQLRETLQVMHALRIPVTNLPGTPVRPLAWAIRSLPAFVSRPLLVNAVGKGRGKKMPSFHIDLHQNHAPSEVGFLNGAVARFAEKPGIHTPANQVLTNTLLDLSNGVIPLDSFRHQPQKLLDLIQQN